MMKLTDPRSRERLLVFLLTLLGAALRFWAFGALGLTHFDEGIYAISGLWAVAPGGLANLDPGVIPYAPPGFPFLVGLAYGALGVSDAGAILVAAAAGVAVIPIAAWVGRRTFGPGAGIGAAALAALSVAAIAFSRKALTDIPFLACWLVAVGAAGRFLERPGFGRAVVLGVCVGLAQYFKYNGWLAGLVTILAVFSGAVVHRDQRPALLKTLGFGLLAALVAIGLYVPWVAFVERHGSYAGLLRHHRSYLRGIMSWLPHWKIQLAQVHALSGGALFSGLAWALAWSGTAFVLRPGTVSARWVGRFLAGLLLGTLALGALTNLPWWIGLSVCVPLLGAKEASRRVLGAWWILLTVLTPFYHPYARLWLPMHAAGWIIVSGVGARLADWSNAPVDLSSRARIALPVSAALCLLAAAVQMAVLRPAEMPASWVFSPAPSLREAAFALANDRSRYRDRQAFVVLARRPLAFYLTLGGQGVRLAENAASLQHPVSLGDRAIVDETLLAQERDPAKEWMRLRKYWTVEDQFREDLDPVTLLDTDPSAAYHSRPKRTFLLWRLAPNGSTRPAP